MTGGINWLSLMLTLNARSSEPGYLFYGSVTNNKAVFENDIQLSITPFFPNQIRFET
jgi:hypothetical protein